MTTLLHPVVLDRKLLRRLLACRPADTWSADWSSVAYLGLDKRVYAVHLDESIEVLPVDDGLREVLRSVRNFGRESIAA